MQAYLIKHLFLEKIPIFFLLSENSISLLYFSLCLLFSEISRQMSYFEIVKLINLWDVLLSCIDLEI